MLLLGVFHTPSVTPFQSEIGATIDPSGVVSKSIFVVSWPIAATAVLKAADAAFAFGSAEPNATPLSVPVNTLMALAEAVAADKPMVRAAASAITQRLMVLSLRPIEPSPRPVKPTGEQEQLPGAMHESAAFGGEFHSALLYGHRTSRPSRGLRSSKLPIEGLTARSAPFALLFSARRRPADANDARDSTEHADC